MAIGGEVTEGARNSVLALVVLAMLAIGGCAAQSSGFGSAGNDDGCGGLLGIEDTYKSLSDSVHAGTATNASVDKKLVALANKVQASIDLAGTQTKPLLQAILTDVQTTRGTVDGDGIAAAGANADQLNADITSYDRLCTT